METLAPLPVAIPLLAAAALVGAGPVLPRWARDAAAVAVAAAVAAIAAVLMARSDSSLLVHWFGNWRPRGDLAIGIGFAIDPFGAGLATLVAGLVAAALTFSWRYFKEVGALYHGLMLVFLAGMAGFCLTGDLFNMFVFFELMSVAAYALTGYKVEEVESLEGALNFAIVNSVGAFLTLLGIALIYGRTGALNLAQIGRALSVGPPDGLVLAAFVLVAAGFLVKGAIVPFHFWLADAHAVAPTPVCVLFSGVMVELGLYAVARVYWTAFSGPINPGCGAIRGVFLAFGTTSALLGAVMCLLQRHLKRLLAFSTISHGGMIAMGFALVRPSALAGAAIYVLGHGLVKGGLFLGAGIVLHRLRGVDTIDLRGRGRRLPYTATLFAVGGLGLAGLPPFGTWLGKTLIEEEAGRLDLPWVAPVLVVASLLTGAAVLRAAGGIFLGLGPAPVADAPGAKGHEGGETEHGHGRTPLTMLLPAALLVLGALATGLVPRLDARAHTAAVRFQDRAGYASAVFGDATATRATPDATSHPLPIALGLASGLGAPALALLLLFAHRLPEAARRVVDRSVRRATVPLRRLHSGHVGDYVAWLVLGVAILGVAMSALVR